MMMLLLMMILSVLGTFTFQFKFGLKIRQCHSHPGHLKLRHWLIQVD